MEVGIILDDFQSGSLYYHAFAGLYYFHFSTFIHYQINSERHSFIVFALGAVYGIGDLSFGLSLRYLGLSLGYALSLGLMLAIGMQIPPLIDNRLKVMVESGSGNLLIAGISVAVIGIALSALARISKDKAISQDKNKRVFLISI